MIPLPNTELELSSEYPRIWPKDPSPHKGTKHRSPNQKNPTTNQVLIWSGKGYYRIVAKPKWENTHRTSNIHLLIFNKWKILVAMSQYYEDGENVMCGYVGLRVCVSSFSSYFMAHLLFFLILVSFIFLAFFSSSRQISTLSVIALHSPLYQFRAL